MAYTTTNFKTKKALRETVAQYLQDKEDGIDRPRPVTCFQPGLGPDLSSFTGNTTVEGPHYPQPHKWYAKVWLENGIVVKVS